MLAREHMFADAKVKLGFNDILSSSFAPSFDRPQRVLCFSRIHHTYTHFDHRQFLFNKCFSSFRLPSFVRSLCGRSVFFHRFHYCYFGYCSIGRIIVSLMRRFLHSFRRIDVRRDDYVFLFNFVHNDIALSSSHLINGVWCRADCRMRNESTEENEISVRSDVSWSEHFSHSFCVHSPRWSNMFINCAWIELMLFPHRVVRWIEDFIEIETMRWDAIKGNLILTRRPTRTDWNQIN